MNTAPDTTAEPPVEAVNLPPALPATDGTPPPPVPVASKKPSAPRRPAAEQPAMDASSESAHSPAPQISPDISPRDQASLQRSTGDDVAVAEKNLENVRGKQLNASQQDLADKIRNFVAESRQASKDGDWARAQTLAQKARLLSVELINSL